MQASISLIGLLLFWGVCHGAVWERESANEHDRMRRSPSGNGNNACSEVVSPVPAEIVREYGLRPFFTKCITVYGIPITSSNAVDDRALQRACYTVRYMLAGSRKLREGMKSGKARIAIIAPNEKIFQVPAYRRYSRRPSWANRRGIGGTLYRPVTVASQENLLCQNKTNSTCDQEEDILVHELSHTIHRIACSKELAFFDERLYNAYKIASKAGLWQRTSSAFNHREYFAMGVLAYMNQLHENPLGGGSTYRRIHNHTELEAHDRALYNLVTQILPCSNNYIPKSPDFDLNQVSSQELSMDCDAELPDYSDFDCVDYIKGCSNLLDGCTTKSLVIKDCKKSCGKC